MPDEAAFFHQVRALVHQSRTILAPYLCGDHTFDVAAHELAPVIRAFLQHPAPTPAPAPKPEPAPATPLWRRLTMGRLSFKREAPPDTSPVPTWTCGWARWRRATLTRTKKKCAPSSRRRCASRRASTRAPPDDYDITTELDVQ